MAKILIVDDHPLVRAGLTHLISEIADLEVCGEAGDMAEGLKLVASLEPDLAIIDLSLAGGSGLDLIKHIKAHDYKTLMLVASMHDEMLYAERVLTAGAHGYINKQEAQHNIVTAIRQVLGGEVYLSEQMTRHLLRGMISGMTNKRDIEALSNRELEVFDLIGQGVSVSDMSKHLNLSIKTIETHQTHIKQKLGLSSTHKLSNRAIRWLLEENK